jgi:hypothetical protein
VFPTFDMCALMNLTENYGKTNATAVIPQVGIFNQSFIKQQIDVLHENTREYFPEKFHPCPLKVDDLTVFNYSSILKNDFERTLPDGDYRYEHKYWTDDDENVFTKVVYEKYKTGEDPLF